MISHFDNNNVRPVIFDNETGKEIKINDETLDTVVKGNNDSRNIYKLLTTNTQIDFKVSSSSLDMFNNLIGVDTGLKSDSCSVEFIKYVNNKNHKKKRINKKWAKLYGVRPVVISTYERNSFLSN